MAEEAPSKLNNSNCNKQVQTEAPMIDFILEVASTWRAQRTFKIQDKRRIKSQMRVTYFATH
jgi:hypothetical protein